jgi:hypothetical protein
VHWTYQQLYEYYKIGLTSDGTPSKTAYNALSFEVSYIPALADEIVAPAIVRDLNWNELFSKHGDLPVAQVKLYVVTSREGSFTVR